ncbi:hypothetical protein ACLOJK_038848 [Asimina triloba]
MVHRRSTKIRCSIFSKEPPPDPPPASFRSAVLPSSSNPKSSKTTSDHSVPLLVQHLQTADAIR